MTRNLFSLRAVIKKFMDIQFIISIASLVVIILLNIYEITMRGLFDKSLIWIQDISVLLMCWMLFPGFSKIVYDKQDIVITILYDKLPEKMKIYLVDVFLRMVVILFTVIFSLFSYRLIVKQIGQGTITAHIPLVYYTSAVFLNAFSLAVINIEELVATVLKLKENGVDL